MDRLYRRPPHSCEFCRRIILDHFELPQHQARSSANQETYQSKTSISYERLSEGAESGCLLFRKILSNASLTNLKTGVMEARSDGTLRLSLAFGSNWRADAKYDGDLARFHYRWDWEGEGSNGGQLNACAVAGNPAAKDILSRPLVKRRREANFLWAEWLLQCDREHARCMVEADVMPGRLLFLGSNDSEECAFRLVDSAPGEKLQYAALSYCWGGDQPYKTTKENRQAYYQESGIPHDALAPFKTITDAIYVARLLGLSYLWIDSLCIVQDDAEDQGREIGKMQDIYAGAYVTISAACAATCRDGFLDSMNDDDDNSEDDFEMDYPCIDGTVGAVFLTKDQMISHRDPQPIDARAWTFQEYFLSPRVLVFERRKVRWSCFTAVHEDGGHDNDSGFRLLNSGKLAQLSADELDQEWAWAVERFAQRYLTVQSDKLPAMAGVAARFSPRFGGSRYCAGIWEARLAQQLAWDVSWGNVRSTRPSYRLRDAAPTWSWASIDGLIMFAGHNGGGVEVRRLEFEDYERTLVSDDAPFGAVSAATLVVRARVRRVARASAYSIRPDANLRGFSGYHATIRGDVIDEVESIQEEKKELRCLETSTYVWTNARKETYLLSKGLLVVPAGKKSFKRLGTFEISCPIETCREGGRANPDLGLESECQTSERQQDEQHWIDRYWFVDCKPHVVELV